MKNRLILDSQITASSSKFYESHPYNGRKDLTEIPGVRYGGWIAADDDGDSWFQVDFIINATVSILDIQELAGTNHSVTKYSISYGDDVERLSNYTASSEAVEGVSSPKVKLIKLLLGSTVGASGQLVNFGFTFSIISLLEKIFYEKIFSVNFVFFH